MNEFLAYIYKLAERLFPDEKSREDFVQDFLAEMLNRICEKISVLSQEHAEKIANLDKLTNEEDFSRTFTKIYEELSAEDKLKVSEPAVKELFTEVLTKAKDRGKINKEDAEEYIKQAQEYGKTLNLASTLKDNNASDALHQLANN